MRIPLFIALLATGGCTSTGPDDSGDPADTTEADKTPILLSVGGGGSAAPPFAEEYVEADCPTDCSVNTNPTLSAAQVFVNGVPVVSPAPTEGDTVSVAIAYEDAECNLACGGFTYGWMSPLESLDSNGSLPSNLPCGTAESGVHLGFDFGTVEPGDYSWSLSVEDGCFGASTRIDGEFTVAP